MREAVSSIDCPPDADGALVLALPSHSPCLHAPCHSDDPNIYMSTFERCMDGRVGFGLFPGDKGYKSDLYHLVERIMDLTLPGHSLREIFKNALWQALLQDNVCDKELCISTGCTKKAAIRQHCPPPDQLRVRFDTVVQSYINAHDQQVHNQCLFIKDCAAGIQKIRADIDQWFFSGGCGEGGLDGGGGGGRYPQSNRAAFLADLNHTSLSHRPAATRRRLWPARGAVQGLGVCAAAHSHQRGCRQGRRAP